MLSEPAPGIRETLSDEDIRKRRDAIVRRGWAEILRRVFRHGVLLATDVLWSSAAVIVTVLALEALAQDSTATRESVWRVAAMTLLLQPFTLQAFGAYQGGRRRASLGAVLAGVASAATLAWVGTLLLALPLSTWAYPAYAVVATVLVFAGRVLLDRLVQVAYSRGLGTRKRLVVGTKAETWSLAAEFGRDLGSDIEIAGRLSPYGVADAGSLGTLQDLEEALRRTGARGVVVASNLDFKSLESLARQCFELGATVGIVPKMLHKLGGRLELRSTHSGVVVQLHPRGMGVPQLVLKRAMDLVLCGLGVLLISPLLLLIAVAIKLDSPGPVFFKQVRAGVGGRPFRMFKFRSMVADADAMKARLQHLNESGDPRLFKIKGDPRITRVGRLLRKTSLDELPQLFNVLRGEMSLVGPRPFFPNDLDGYEDHHFERLFVLPGITGLWQVSGRSDVVDFEEVVRLDAQYIRDWSVGMDLSILWRTLPAALGRGAY
jgi:exopolysaccharide biosynthesis polyprenyl glycosylphosphotransferase